jgi:hypothetical protein
MDDYLEVICHDAFHFGGGLNKSAAEIYWCLKQEPMTAIQLIEKTGRGRSTVFRALNRMASIVDTRTGELIPMVKSADGLWSADTSVDLNRVALILGTAGIGKRKREQYKHEQIEHKNELRAGRQAQN